MLFNLKTSGTFGKRGHRLCSFSPQRTPQLNTLRCCCRKFHGVNRGRRVSYGTQIYPTRGAGDLHRYFSFFSHRDTELSEKSLYNSEVGSQRSEIRGQRSEVRGQFFVLSILKICVHLPAMLRNARRAGLCEKK